MKINKQNEQNEKQQIIDLYTTSSQKLLTRGNIKQATLDKIMEDINANCKKKARN